MPPGRPPRSSSRAEKRRSWSCPWQERCAQRVKSSLASTRAACLLCPTGRGHTKITNRLSLGCLGMAAGGVVEPRGVSPSFLPPRLRASAETLPAAALLRTPASSLSPSRAACFGCWARLSRALYRALEPAVARSGQLGLRLMHGASPHRAWAGSGKTCSLVRARAYPHHWISEKAAWRAYTTRVQRRSPAGATRVFCPCAAFATPRPI